MREEAEEVVEAIESGDPAALCDELGDLLLQVVIHAVIAEEAGHFTLDDVARGVIAKMERRNPHVFGDAVADDVAEVMALWNAAKAAEKAGEKARPCPGRHEDRRSAPPVPMTSARGPRRPVRLHQREQPVVGATREHVGHHRAVRQHLRGRREGLDEGLVEAPGGGQARDVGDEPGADPVEPVAASTCTDSCSSTAKS